MARLARLLRKLFKVVAIIAISIVVLFAGLFTLKLAFDRYLTHYRPLDTLVDKNGLVIELAETADGMAGSFYGELNVFEDVDPDRRPSGFRSPVIFLHPHPDGWPTLSYDGKWYVVTARGADVYSYSKEWSEWFGTRKLCFEVKV